VRLIRDADDGIVPAKKRQQLHKIPKRQLGDV